MDYTTLPEAGLSQVRLRLLAPADIPDWFDYLTRPEVYEHTSWDVKAPEELAQHLPAWQSRTPDAPLRLAIADRATDRLVGTVGFHTVQSLHRSAELAYDLSPAVWGQGIARQLCGVMVGWAHEQAGLLRVQATVLTSNTRSAQVLQRNGFVREGLLRSYRQVRGRPGDFWMWSHVRNPDVA